MTAKETLKTQDIILPATAGVKIKFLIKLLLM